MLPLMVYSDLNCLVQYDDVLNGGVESRTHTGELSERSCE